MADKGYGYLNVAVEGCCHGELDRIYATILQGQQQTGVNVDLLLICGDFESIRDRNDLNHMAVPPKYRSMNTFHDYVTGKKVAPITTIFVGGNHEASNYLQALYYGGWVAPNIYFLGYAGVVWYGGLRIAGISGIYNYHHYRLGHYEYSPYSHDTIKSIYHIREFEIYRLAHLVKSHHVIDIICSHDWPQNIWEYGDKQWLLRTKPFLRDDMMSGRLAAPPLMELLKMLKPSFWFAAHLHVKFPAIVKHDDMLKPPPPPPPTSSSSSTSIMLPLCSSTSTASQPSRSTRFVALDKVLPGRDFLQIIKIPKQCEGKHVIEHDIEWLAIVQQTHHLLSTSRDRVHLPTEIRSPSTENIDAIRRRLEESAGNYEIPMVSGHDIPATSTATREGNQQTDDLLHLLGLNHIWTIPMNSSILGMHTHAHEQAPTVREDTISGLSQSSSTGLSSIPTQIKDHMPLVASVDANEIDIDDL